MGVPIIRITGQSWGSPILETTSCQKTLWGIGLRPMQPEEHDQYACICFCRRPSSVVVFVGGGGGVVVAAAAAAAAAAAG